jgi:hypothetical protein
MRVLESNYGWNPIETAPLDEDVTLEVTDGRGAPYRLPYRCRRTASGWVSSSKGTPLAVTPVRWKPLPGGSWKPRHPTMPARMCCVVVCAPLCASWLNAWIARMRACGATPSSLRWATIAPVISVPCLRTPQLLQTHRVRAGQLEQGNAARGHAGEVEAAPWRFVEAMTSHKAAA